MAKIWLAHPRPLLWQNFEDLAHQVLIRIFNDPSASKHGRGGQKQNGVDVHGRSDGIGKLIAIQCKRREQVDASGTYPFGFPLTQQDILEEVEKAEKSPLPIEQFIVGTTAPADAKIQAWAEKLNEDRWQQQSQKKSFRIAVWHWQDFDGFLNSNSTLQHWYTDLVSGSGNGRIAETHILSLVHDAFSRPAFRDRLAQENPHKFRLALEHTQKAIDLGELVDRETGVVIRKALGGIKKLEIFDAARRLGPRLSRTLTSLRNVYDTAKQEPLYTQGQHTVMKLDDTGGFLAINDPATATMLENLRQEAIDIVNDMMKDAGLPPVG